jgi:hypothetical protein
MGTSAAAIRAQTERLVRSAERVTWISVPEAGVDPAAEAVTRIEAVHAVEAECAVIRSVDETVGAVLDLLA